MVNLYTKYKSGDRHGMLMLTGKAYIGNGKCLVEYICECGNIKFGHLYSILKGTTKSCGCKKVAHLIQMNTTHGFAANANRHPLYALWASIIQRCYYSKHRSFKNYGGKGVEVCEEWRNSFQSFYDWAIDKWEIGLDLDKDILYKKKFGIQTSGKMYSPEFCCFISRKENSRSKRTNHLITAFGETKCIAAWADDDRCTISYTALNNRISRGWDSHEAVSTSTKRIVN